MWSAEFGPLGSVEKQVSPRTIQPFRFFQKPRIQWWEPNPWLFGVRYGDTTWREALRPIRRALVVGFVLGLGMGLGLTWIYKVEFSIGVVLVVGVLFSMLCLVLSPIDLLAPSLIQVTERGLRRMPIIGNPIEHKFDELEFFSLLDVCDDGREPMNRMLVIKLRSAEEIRIIVPKKVTHEEIRKALGSNLPECMPA